MKLFLLFFVFVLFSNHCRADDSIMINEFLIDPQPQKVEIINVSSESAVLDNWIIDDDGGSSNFIIPKETVIMPNSCLIFSKDFNLNKSSPDTIRLLNDKLDLIDHYSYKSSLGSGISFARIPDGENSWSSKEASFGLFNLSLSSCFSTANEVSPSPTVSPELTTITPSVEALITPTDIPKDEIKTVNTITNVYINEVMVNPEAGEKEWIEIYNDNDFTLTLENWLIDDQENKGSSPRAFSIEIPPKSYRCHILSGPIFNNDGDSVRLIDSFDNLVDDFQYPGSSQGISYGRNPSDREIFCQQPSSFEKENFQCIENVKDNKTDAPSNLFLREKKNPIPSIGKIRISIYPLANTASQKIFPVPQVLGKTTRIIFPKTFFVSRLCIVCFLYSLLTISSVLIKIKLSYGKNHRLHQESFRSS